MNDGDGGNCGVRKTDKGDKKRERERENINEKMKKKGRERE